LDARKRLGSLLPAPGSLFHQLLDVRRDRLQPTIQCGLRGINQRNPPAMLRKHVRDAVAHRPRPDDGDFTHAATGPKASLRVNKNSDPPSSAMVATMPPSGPKAPPSTQRCAPAVYSTTGTWKTKPETGASKRIARPAFQPKCAPHASCMPPFAKNARDSQIAASATLIVLKTVALGFRAWARPNRQASSTVAGITPSASESLRSGKPRKASSSPTAARMSARSSGSATWGHRLQSPVKCTRAPSSRTASPIADDDMIAPSA